MKKIYLFLLAAMALLVSTTAMAQDEDYGWDVDEAVVTEDNWDILLSSPFSDSAEGQDLHALIDENTGTFWHTDWHNESSKELGGNHYLQIEMPDWVTEETELVMRFTRRNTSNDHTIYWKICGTNNPDFCKEEECEELQDFDSPFTNNTETLTSEVFTTQGYKYIRIYSEAQYPNTRTYWHVSELNLYTIRQLTEEDVIQREWQRVLDEYSQYYQAFPVGTTAGYYGEAEVAEFDAAIEAIYALDEPGAVWPPMDELKAMIERVKTAYDAVLASMVTTDIAEGYYRIASGMWYTNTYDDDRGTVEHRKYMMGHRQDGKLWGIWASSDFGGESAEIRKLWKITKKDGFYDVVSMFNNARFNDVKQSTNVEMSEESENLMAIEAAGVDADGTTFIHFRVSSQNAANDGLYLHQNNHGDGSGENGFLVGWYSTFDDAALLPGASEWILEAVEAEEAEQIIKDYEPIRQRSEVISNINTILANAEKEIEIAKDVQTIWDDEPLIKEAWQFSSPYSQNDHGSADGGNLSDGVLIDGDKGTFWHSYWGGGNQPNGLHYLQVEIVDDEVATIAFKGYRRAADNDHVTKWSVYGSNDEDLEDELGKEGCDSLTTFDTPFGASNEYIESPVFDTKGYKYIRLYEEATSGTGGSSYENRGYWHVAEIQFYRAQSFQSPTCQYNVLGDIVKNLEAVMAEGDEINGDEASLEELQAYYEKLKAAYDPFAEKFVDPTALRDAMAAATEKTGLVVEGTNPGFWPSNSTAVALDNTIAEAKAYDESGAYTPAQSDKLIETIEAQGKAIDEAVIGLKEGRWYRIRFGTEEEYEKYGWSTDGDLENTNEAGEVTDEGILGKYMTLASYEDNNGIHIISPANLDEIALGDNIFFDDDEDIEDKDLSMFRFINVGDTAFIMQNKATGLFVKAAGTTGHVTLSVHPTIFKQEALGLGANLLAANDLNGDKQSYLHFARNNNIIETYNAPTIGGRSSIYIEDAGEVAADYDGSKFKMSIVEGKVYTYCFPVSLKAEAGQMYGVSAVELTDEGAKVSLMKIAEAAAGRPFIFINGDTEAYDAEAEPDLLGFTHAMDLVAEPDTNSVGLKGTYTKATIGKGVIQASSNKFVVTKSSTASVNANSAWIVAETELDKSAQIELIIDGNAEDGIQTALSNVAKSGAIYSIDGRLVGNGNLNTLSKLGRGVYILGGTKVTVK